MRSATRSRNEYGPEGSASSGTTSPMRRQTSSWAGLHPESRDAWMAV